VLDRRDLGLDQRFATAAARNGNRKALETEIAGVLCTRPAAAWLSALDEAGVPCGQINSIDQALAHPQIEARGLVRAMRRPDGTSVPIVGYPARLSATPASYRRAPPRFAQDTRRVLGALLGLDEEAVARLETRGVIACAPD